MDYIRYYGKQQIIFKSMILIFYVLELFYNGTGTICIDVQFLPDIGIGQKLKTQKYFIIFKLI